MSGTGSLASVWICDRQLFGGIKRDDLRALGRENHFFLDARGGDAVARGAVGFDREHHARLQLDRLLERSEPRDQRPLMQSEPQPVAEVETKSLHLARKADFLRLRERARDLVARHPGLEELDRLVYPFARSSVRGALRGRRAPDVESAVVAGAVAHERLDDIEEGLVARADEAVGEVVRVRRAALA